MWDFGNSDSHSNQVIYSNVTSLNALTTMTMAAWVELNALMTATNLDYFGKYTPSVGWNMVFTGSEGIRLIYNGSTTGQSGAGLISVDGIPHSTMYTIASGSGDTWFDGVDQSNVSGFAPTTTSNVVKVGAVASGAPCKVGHAMAWDADVGTVGKDNYHSGNIGAGPPALADLRFWTKCVGTPPTDAEIPVGDPGTKNNTVTEHLDPIDGYYGFAGGFAYLIAMHWGTLIGASSLFGAALRMEPSGKLLRAIREEMGCHFYGTPEDHKYLIEAAEFPRRSRFAI